MADLDDLLRQRILSSPGSNVGGQAMPTQPGVAAYPQGIPMPQGTPPMPQNIAAPPQQATPPPGLLGQPTAPDALAAPPPPDHSAAPTDPRMIELRQRYEAKLPSLKTEAQYRDLWRDYMNKAKQIDPSLVLYPDQWKINFPEKYPEYATPGGR